MIDLQNVSVTFVDDHKREVNAVRNVSLKVERGDVYGIVGYSGAGKSTLVRTINLLQPPTEGKVFVNNNEITALGKNDLREARKKIGMIFQHFNLMDSRTIFDNVAFPLKRSDLTKQEITEIKKVAVDLLAKVKTKIAELDHWADKPETKAIVDNLIRDTLWAELPESYDEISITAYRKEIYEYIYLRYKTAA